MLRARDMMTGSLITCVPEVSVAEAAQLMRDRNTGDVLVTQQGKLLGILTDRDISLRVAAKGLDSQEVPVKDVMSKHLITGQPTWDLDKISKTMGKHQIRRLPILDNGMLVGIISLGDLALRDSHRSDVAKSLRHISEPHGIHRRHSKGSSRLGALLGLGLVVGAVVALSMSPRPVSEVWQDFRENQLDKWIDSFQKSDLYERLTDAFEEGRDRLSDLAG